MLRVTDNRCPVQVQRLLWPTTGETYIASLPINIVPWSLRALRHHKSLVFLMEVINICSALHFAVEQIKVPTISCKIINLPQSIKSGIRWLRHSGLETQCPIKRFAIDHRSNEWSRIGIWKGLMNPRYFLEGVDPKCGRRGVVVQARMRSDAIFLIPSGSRPWTAVMSV